MSASDRKQITKLVNPNEILTQFKQLEAIDVDLEGRQQKCLFFNKALHTACDLNEVFIVIRSMVQEKFYPDKNMIGSLLIKLSKYGTIDHVKEVYNDAVFKIDMDDVYIYSAILSALDNHGDLESAICIHLRATIAYENKKMSQNDMAIINNHMIKIAMKHDDINLATTLLQGSIDVPAMMDFLVWNNKLGAAKNLYKEHKYSLPMKMLSFPNQHGQLYEIDLHGLSLGIAYLILD